MEHILNFFSTLWIYARRNRYIANLQAEDAGLSVRDYDLQKPQILQQVRYRRAQIAEEIRCLRAPFSWRSLFNAPPIQLHRAAIIPSTTVGDEYARAA